MDALNDFLTSLEDYLDEPGVTQKSLAKQAGISPSQVSDWRKGGIKRMSPNAKKVREVIEKIRKPRRQQVPVEIEAAVRRVWNGTSDDAKAIAKVIDSLESFTR